MEDFVSFEIAKKLKEKGFREKCYAYYSYSEPLKFYIIQDAVPSRQLTINDFKGCKNCYIENGKYDAPTISQVLKWLREEKGLYVGIYYVPKVKDAKSDFYFPTIQKLGDFEPTIHIDSNVIFSNYEETAIAGIEYVLDNLL